MCNPCAACPPPFWNAYVAGTFRAHDDRVSGHGQLMLPLVQNGQALFFADLRAAFDDNSNSEGNFGLGKRVFASPFSIFGGYVFYDYIESSTDRDIDKITVGMEYLTVPFEARVNGYIPLTDNNNGLPVTFVDERTLYGIDAEIGWLMADYGLSELRAFVGGFTLGSDAPGIDDNLIGPRVRLELRSYAIAWGSPDSRLTLGAEYQWDEVRDSEVNLMARLMIPLGAPQPMGATRLHRRMYDRIVRSR